MDSVKLKMNDRDLDYLESQNDEDITGLSAKVKLLKNVSFGLWYKRKAYSCTQITGKIGDEIRYGNGLIDNMVTVAPFLV